MKKLLKSLKDIILGSNWLFSKKPINKNDRFCVNCEFYKRRFFLIEPKCYQSKNLYHDVVTGKKFIKTNLKDFRRYDCRGHYFQLKNTD